MKKHPWIWGLLETGIVPIISEIYGGGNRMYLLNIANIELHII